jgi:hypothetical protein
MSLPYHINIQGLSFDMVVGRHTISAIEVYLVGNPDHPVHPILLSNYPSPYLRSRSYSPIHDGSVQLWYRDPSSHLTIHFLVLDLIVDRSMLEDLARYQADRP